MAIYGAQNIFPPGRERIITFNYNDFADATGYVTYDLMAFQDTTTNYVLVPSSLTSGLMMTADHGTVVSDAPTYIEHTSASQLDTDFDSTVFNLPRTVRGKAFARIPWDFGGTTPTITMQTILTLYKWDGVSETQIGQGKSTDLSIAEQENTLLITFDCTETLIKKGEQLRLTLSMDIDAIGGTNLFNRISLNPQDTVSGGFVDGNSRSRIIIPFKLEG
jgi:hypothetical protein